MNVFEDLIIELKENNLLESTVVENEMLENADVNVTMDFAIDSEAAHEMDASPMHDQVEAAVVVSGEGIAQSVDEPGPQQKSSTDHYKKRAVSEVSGLQMVEHVLTGVEREYMKIVPKTFDDLNAKKALHTFLNSDASSKEHASAEFFLLQETEAWCTALGERDNNIPVSSLRLYCENSKPALSSQALVALARFYRNLPYTEQRRSKFDCTMTRLFSRATNDESRVCLFGRDDMLSHINTLYKEWSSIPLYTAEEDDSKVLLTALSFDDLANEAEQASTFDQLITSDFFSRLRLFKESISELFFAPNVTAAAIECNIRIGNAYVNLIHLEREKMSEESIESKYADINDQAVSDAAARTLQLVDLLRGPAVVDEPKPEVEEPAIPVEKETLIMPDKLPKAKEDKKSAREMPPFLRRIRDNAFAVNKWFAGAAVLMIAISIGVWVWANYMVEEHVSSAGVATVVLDGVLAEQIKSGRISSRMLYGMLGPNWESLSTERREEYLQKVLEVGPSKGFDKVTLIGKDGKIAGYASPKKITVKTY